jgi:hypothetical protein
MRGRQDLEGVRGPTVLMRDWEQLVLFSEESFGDGVIVHFIFGNK